MRERLSVGGLTVAFIVVQWAGRSDLNGTEWRYFSPILSTQTKAASTRELETVLARVCQTPIRNVVGVGETCTTRGLSSGFSDITDRMFHPKGVIFGHFLGPESDDAAVSGWSAETHPYLWGGTLLLNKRSGSWVPLWYRSALIVDACERVALPDQREILLCENEDSGMGHALHFLYVVDFAHPTKLNDSLLAKADSFTDDCVKQTQVLKDLRWREDRKAFSVQLDTTVWTRVSTEPYCSNYPKSRPASHRLTFVVTSRGFRNVGTTKPADKQ